MEAIIPTDSTGNYSLPPGYLAVTGQTVLASQHNPPLEDLGTSMSARVMRDGRTPMLGNIQMNGYRAKGAANAEDAQDYVTLAQMQAAIAAVSGVPTGALIPLTGMVVPASWVIANGQTLLRATYPSFWTWVQASGNLAASEGVKTVGQYGPGDGSTTFTVPNLYADNGYFIRPISSGRTIGTVQADELKSHGHTASTGNAGAHWHQYQRWGLATVSAPAGVGTSTAEGEYANDTSTSGDHTHPVAVSNTGGAETRPRNIAYPVLIKT